MPSCPCQHRTAVQMVDATGSVIISPDGVKPVMPR